MAKRHCLGKAVLAGRVDKKNKHLLLTTKGHIRSRVVRRNAEIQGLPWDILKGSAEMLRNALVRPGEQPRPWRGRHRKDGFPAQARMTTTSGQEAIRDAMPRSSESHQRQTGTEMTGLEEKIGSSIDSCIENGKESTDARKRVVEKWNRQTNKFSMLVGAPC